VRVGPATGGDPPRRPPRPVDRAIAAHVAERIPHGATIQVGIGTIAAAVLEALGDHRGLGVHTELLHDGMVDLVESGVITGVNKEVRRNRIVTTFCLGSRAALRLARRQRVGRAARRRLRERPPGDRPHAQVRVGQRHHRGRPDRPVRVGDDQPAATGRRQVARPTSPAAPCTPTTGRPSSSPSPPPATAGHASCPTLSPGSVVTTSKNTVDHVVTEHGVAELRGRSIAERARALIAVAHPDHRDDLERSARQSGLLR
jgi:hypothetical protein